MKNVNGLCKGGQLLINVIKGHREGLKKVTVSLKKELIKDDEIKSEDKI